MICVACVDCQVGLPSQGLSGVASGYRPMGGERSNSTQLQAAQVYECLMYQGVHGMSLGGFMAGMIPQGMAAGPHMMGPMYPQNVMSHAIPQGGSMMGTSPWVQQPSIPMGAVNEPTGTPCLNDLSQVVVISVCILFTGPY